MAGTRGEGISRRTFLKAGAAAAAGTLAFPAVVRADWKQIANVVIARFGGGVRYRETFGDPYLKNLPGMMRNLVGKGTLYTHVYNDGDTSHQGGTLQILTGKRFDPSLATRHNPKIPTLFEYYRREMGRKAGPNSGVVVDHSTVDFQFNYSVDPDYGFDFRGRQFQPRLITYHHLNDVLRQESDANSDLSRRARALQDQVWVREDYEHIEDPTRPMPKLDDFEQKFVKAIFARDRVPRVSTGDELVLHFALAAMEESDFRPRLVQINFAGPDIAHRGSYTDYVGQVRALDELVSRLWMSIQRNRAYLKHTLLIVIPDCGRSLSGQGRGGFVDHIADDEGARHVWALFVGPGIPANKKFTRPYSQIDIAATVGEILDVPTPGCDGVVMEETR